MAENAFNQDFLLPCNVLDGTRLGISVSGSTDLARLGLLETHFRLALGEIARCILAVGGEFTYGGHLDPDGYTALDEHLAKGLTRLADMRAKTSWGGLQNGLSDAENRQLAATHRPSEIAALICLGLGKRFSSGGTR